MIKGLDRDIHASVGDPCVCVLCACVCVFLSSAFFPDLVISVRHRWDGGSRKTPETPAAPFNM